jgi:hypothetical protein
MKIALVCEKWRLPVMPGKAAIVPGEDKRVLGYYEYINAKSHEVGRNAFCIEFLLNRLPKGLAVVEAFGGVGVFATIVQNVIKPSFHLIMDLDDDCYHQLQNAFNPDEVNNILVEQADARLVMTQVAADLYLLDFPFFTMVQYSKWKDEWDAIVAHQPKAIVWMDGASKYLHLHTELYSKVSEFPISDHTTYIQGVRKFILERHNYTVTACAFSTGCYYFLAEPGWHQEPPVIVQEKRQGGLKWIAQ